MKLAVTGGRYYNPSRAEMQELLDLFRRIGGTELHHGACSGVDQDVAAFMAGNGVKVIAHPAKWRRPDGSRDRSAGPRRNAEMSVVCAAVAAFRGGTGTAGCCALFAGKGKPVYRILRDSVPTKPD